MKKRLLFCLVLILPISILNGQIILNEIETTGLERIELKNISGQTVDVNNFILCSYPTYNLISDITIISGNYLMAPGDIVVVRGHLLGDTDGELAIYLNYNFTNPNSIIDYVEWGSPFHVRSTIAQQAGIWSSNDFVPSPPANVSLEYDGTGNASTDWYVQVNPTFGMENGILSGGYDLLDSFLSIHFNYNSKEILIKSTSVNFPITAIELSDVHSKSIMDETVNYKYDVRINTQNFKSGIYFIKIKSNFSSAIKKIIIS